MVSVPGLEATAYLEAGHAVAYGEEEPGRSVEHYADAVEAMVMLHDHPGKVADKHLAYLRARAQDVNTHWYLIDAVAAELLTRRRLSNSAVHSVIHEAIRTQAKIEVAETMNPGGWRRLAWSIGVELAASP
jgi:hypothetical protein